MNMPDQLRLQAQRYFGDSSQETQLLLCHSRGCGMPLEAYKAFCSVLPGPHFVRAFDDDHNWTAAGVEHRVHALLLAAQMLEDPS